MDERGLTTDDFCVEVKVINKAEMAALMTSSDVVLSF
jgi:sulfur relay (sulfurtransferase) DsrF/TusC family protein